MKRGIFMKGIIKKGSLRCVAFAAACLITVSDANYFNITEVCTASSVSDVYKTWKQGDSRWASLHLGRSPYTMGGYGCAVTSLAALLVHAGNFTDSDFDPGVFCRLMGQYDGFGSSGDIIWWKVSKIAPGFSFKETYYFEKAASNEEKFAKIKSLYKEGYYLIIDVKDSGHWVAIDRIENDTIYSIDPGGNRNPDVFKQYDPKGTTCIKIFKSTGITKEPPAVIYNFQTGRYVTTTRLNVRKSATSASEKLGELEKGTQVNVIQVEGCWGKISYKGLNSWICLDYAEKIEDNTVNPPVSQTPAVTEAAPVTTASVAPVTTVPVTSVTSANPVTQAPVTTVTTVAKEYKKGMYCTNDYLNYREKPDINAALYGVIPVGTQINISEVSGRWGRTEYNGKKCWVCLDYADFISESVTSAVTTAKVTTPVTTEAATTVTSPVTTVATTTVTTTAATTTVTTTTSPVQTTVPETTVSETEPPVTESEENGYILKCRTTDALNFRTGAGTQNEVICVIPKGTELTVLEADSENRWGKVVFNGKTGWVCLDYVVLVEDGTEPSDPEVTEPEKPEEPSLPPAAEIIIGAAGESALKNDNPSEIFRGDVDCNGFINILDYIKLKSIFKGEYTVSEEADVNGDGVVNVSDLVALRKKLVK